MSAALDYRTLVRQAKLTLAKREYDRRNLAELAEKLKDFEFFAEYISHRFGQKDYKHYPFSKKFCQHFQGWAWKARSRLRANMPPRIGKTENGFILGALYIACFVNKSASVAYVTYGASLSQEKSALCRDIYDRLQKSDIGKELELAPLSKHTNSKEHWANTDGFEVQARGVGGSWVGREFNFLIFDDPYKDHEEAFSPTRQRKIWLYWQSSLKTRLAPGARVMIIFTRWDENDIASKIEEMENFETFVIAAFAKDGDILGRKRDEPLRCRLTEDDPKYFDKMKSEIEPFIFEAQFQQDPGNFVGSYFGRIVIQEWRAMSGAIGYVDTAFDGRDYSALAIGGSLGVDDKADGAKKGKTNWQVEGHAWPDNIYDCTDEICNLVQARFIKKLYIEKNADQGGFARYLKQVFKDRNMTQCKIVDETESTDKHARIVTYVYANQENVIYSSNSNTAFLMQLKRYEQGIKPCDGPDAAAGLIKRLMKGRIKRFYDN